VQGDAAVHGEGLEPLAHQLGVEGADLLGRKRAAEDQERPSRDVERDPRQRLVHGQVDIGVAGDAPLVAERLEKRLAEGDAGILGAVVVVDMEIARHLHVEVEEGVARQELQHVVEKADAGGDAGLSRAVEGKGYGHIGLGGAAADARGAHGFSLGGAVPAL
jgi:hypothetical protein